MYTAVLAQVVQASRCVLSCVCDASFLVTSEPGQPTRTVTKALSIRFAACDATRKKGSPPPEISHTHLDAKIRSAPGPTGSSYSCCSCSAGTGACNNGASSQTACISYSGISQSSDVPPRSRMQCCERYITQSLTYRPWLLIFGAFGVPRRAATATHRDALLLLSVTDDSTACTRAGVRAHRLTVVRFVPWGVLCHGYYDHW